MQPTLAWITFSILCTGKTTTAQSTFIAFEFGTIIGHVLVKYTISNLDQVHKNS